MFRVGDGNLTGGQGHPRSAGRFCRVLGRFVREDRLLSLAEAIRKMSLFPVQIWGPRVDRSGVQCPKAARRLVRNANSLSVPVQPSDRFRQIPPGACR